MNKFVEGLTMEEYRKLLNRERKADEPDGEFTALYHRSRAHEPEAMHQQDRADKQTTLRRSRQ